MSYSVRCFDTSVGDGIVVHGTDDRRQLGREGVPGRVRAMCGVDCHRGEASAFNPAAVGNAPTTFACELSVCVKCAERERVMNAARAAVVAEGGTLAYGRPL